MKKNANITYNLSEVIDRVDDNSLEKKMSPN
jgi:hypothetical protein